MSNRYGIDLVFEPSFTSRVYRARQLICGQYGAWAAEMHMLKMNLVPYFQCSETALDLLTHGISRVADQSRRRSPRFSINCFGVSSDRENNGVSLDFHNSRRSVVGLQQFGVPGVDYLSPATQHPMVQLRQDTAEIIAALPGAHFSDGEAPFRPHIALLEHGGLPLTVLADATEFARGVSIDLGIPAVARVWRLVILRYSSNAAGDDWSNGRWASDLSWKCLNSYVL